MKALNKRCLSNIPLESQQRISHNFSALCVCVCVCVCVCALCFILFWFWGGSFLLIYMSPKLSIFCQITYPESWFSVCKLGFKPLLGEGLAENGKVDVLAGVTYCLSQKSSQGTQVVIFVGKQVLEHFCQHLIQHTAHITGCSGPFSPFNYHLSQDPISKVEKCWLVLTVLYFTNLSIITHLFISSMFFVTLFFPQPHLCYVTSIPSPTMISL